MKDTGPKPDESGAHDAIRSPSEYHRRAADCANHNERISKIERVIYMLGGGMVVLSMFGVFAINSYFTSQNEWRNIKSMLDKMEISVSGVAVDIKEIKNQYKEVEVQFREVEKRVSKVELELQRLGTKP